MGNSLAASLAAALLLAVLAMPGRTQLQGWRRYSSGGCDVIAPRQGGDPGVQPLK